MKWLHHVSFFSFLDSSPNYFWEPINFAYFGATEFGIGNRESRGEFHNGHHQFEWISFELGRSFDSLEILTRFILKDKVFSFMNWFEKLKSTKKQWFPGQCRYDVEPKQNIIHTQKIILTPTLSPLPSDYSKPLFNFWNFEQACWKFDWKSYNRIKNIWIWCWSSQNVTLFYQTWFRKK